MLMGWGFRLSSAAGSLMLGNFASQDFSKLASPTLAARLYHTESSCACGSAEAQPASPLTITRIEPKNA